MDRTREVDSQQPDDETDQVAATPDGAIARDPIRIEFVLETGQAVDVIPAMHHTTAIGQQPLLPRAVDAIETGQRSEAQ